MDAMDVDWCLTCNKQTTHGKLFCSRICRMGDDDGAVQDVSYISDDTSSSSDALRESQQQQQRPHSSSRRHTYPSSSHQQLHHQRQQRSPRRTYTHAPQQQFLDAELSAYAQWPGYNDAGIRAWASAIPAGCASAETPSIGLGLSYTRARPEFPLSRQRPAGPALCTDTTQPARPIAHSSSPISLPIPRAADAHAHASCSMSSYSLVSALTESIVTPESARLHTKAHVRAGNGNTNGTGRPSVLEGIARRFRAWGAPPPALKHDAPAEIFMQTTTTTVPASPSPSSPSSPVPRTNTTKANSKTSASGFTVRGVDNEDDEHRSVFAVQLPLAGMPSPLTIGDSELKETLAMGLRGSSVEPKRGVWIAGREKADKGWAGFGPAYYEKDFRARGAVGADELSEREFREFEAWRARGRKAVRR